MIYNRGQFVLFRGLGTKQFLAVMLAAIFVLLIDTSLLKSSVFITPVLHEDTTLFTFVLISIVLAASQYFILGHVRSLYKQMKVAETSALKAIRIGMIVGQFLIFALIATMILQMVTNSFFSSMLMLGLVGVSYGLSIASLSLLAFRFMSWYASDRKILVLLYGVSAIMLVSSVTITLLFATIIMNDKGMEVVPHAGVYWLSFGEGSLKYFINQAYLASSIISFVTVWISTTLLLRDFSKTFGRTQYWVILCIPLVYFLSQFIALFVNVSDYISSMDRTFITLILALAFALSKPVGGILFGLAFWVVSRRIESVAVKNYLIISAFGMILYFTSNQAVVLVSTSFYPPFGTATVSYMALSSYLLLIGIYFSAISVSQDRKILRGIKKSAAKELKLIESIGTAQSQENQEKIINAAMKIVKIDQAQMVEESGVQSGLEEEEIRKHLSDVIAEVKSKGSKQSGKEAGKDDRSI